MFKVKTTDLRVVDGLQTATLKYDFSINGIILNSLEPTVYYIHILFVFGKEKMFLIVILVMYG